MADAKKNSEYRYILCTNNTGQFNCEPLKLEFVENNKSNLLIVRDLKELKQLIDKELKLDLKLKALNKKIENKIKSNTGDIMVAFNSAILKDTIKPHNGFSLSELYDFSQLEEERQRAYDFASSSVYAVGHRNNSAEDGVVVGYNFISLVIDDISMLDNDNNYEIRGSLEVEPKYKEKERNSN